MLFFDSITLRTGLDRQAILAKLEAGMTPVMRMFQPRTVSEFTQSFSGKTFLGRIQDNRFKMILLNENQGRRIIRRGQVVITGSIEESTLHVRFRPAIFSLVFSFFWFAFVAAVFFLLFFSPQGNSKIESILAVVALLAPGATLFFFRQELPVAKERLGLVLGTRV